MDIIRLNPNPNIWDVTRTGRIVFEVPFTNWVTPFSEDAFDHLKRMYLTATEVMSYRKCLNENDLVVIDLLDKMNSEALLNSEEFMKQFKLSYIFLWNLRK